MYAAFIPLMVGTTLLLGSWYGLLFGLILVVGLALRAVHVTGEIPPHSVYLVTGLGKNLRVEQI
jgi:hypothetical protein